MIKKTLLLVFAALTLSYCSFAQQKSNLEKWTWLMGDWQGEGAGQPGQGGGKFSFSLDLDKKVIVRKSHSEYAATNNKPKVVHDDLMIVYLSDGNSLSKAIYFDNEGHVINYSISYKNNTIILLSEKLANLPIFRLTYSLLENNDVNTKFEMSQDGEKFITYIEGKSKKL